ncbi:MAG: Stk1 family PASTA domain-containing Ser/Thr kinase [Oscillospiraceae bacterium]|nr:Stk1 family PASTA domain-containing Ser/Thr kinase [Oscillospiraceae bacterium]
MDKYLGKRLDGRYEITEHVGMGGMANVYMAKDVVEDKPVALKILRDEFIDDEDFLRQFRNESKAIAALSHPNIVKILDVNFGNRIQYIVMEYIGGITLKEYIEQQGTISWKDTVHFTIQILRALQNAHDKGIVHRDIKPHNIMLLQDGTIKVMDFGIARFVRDEARRSSEKTIGSVHYISPEQAKGEPTDEKSDIYSVGIMLYEMLTGKLPFEGGKPEQIAVMQMQATPKMPRQINENIPEGLEEIIIRTMQKSPDQRYQSAAEMLRDIDEFKRNPSIVFEYKYFASEDKTRYFNAIPSDGDSEPDEDEDIYEEEKKSRTIPILAGVAGGVVIVTILTFIFLWIFNVNSDEVLIPRLVGEELEAVKQLHGENFEFYEEARELHDQYDEGIIISAFMDGRDISRRMGETVKSGRRVNLRISAGLKEYEVPDVYNMPESEARARLESEGFSVNKIESFANPSQVSRGNVIKTIPERNQKVPKGSSIDMYINTGNQDGQIEVPRVVGKTAEAAKAELSALGLPVQERSVDSDKPEGTVIAQSPDGGEQVGAGTTVTISVSTGKPAENTVTITVELPEDRTGSYVFRTTVGGTEVKKETVNISTVTRYSVSVTDTGTKDVAIMVSREGSSSSENRLVLYTVNFATSQQTLKAGPNYGVFAPPVQDMVEVPDVMGKPHGTARTMIVALGLQFEMDWDDSSDRPLNEVVWQSHSPGTKLAPGTKVTVLASKGTVSSSSSSSSSEPEDE